MIVILMDEIISFILDHRGEFLHNVTPGILHVIRVRRRFCLDVMHVLKFEENIVQ